MICGEVTMICFGEKKNQFHLSISGRPLALLENITMSLQLYVWLTRPLKTLRHFVETLALDFSAYDRTLANAKQYSNKKNTQQNKASSSKPYI